MASDRSMIQPVFGIGMPRRKPSSDVLDTAENLVENLDSLADILDRLAQKYEIESKYTFSDSVCNNEPEPLVAAERGTEHNLFSKLKTGLDSAKVLIDCLRREKGTLMKRQMSVECRMGEIEDYRKHMKQDMTSLNEMVDLLSVRVVQLETKLCEEQEAYESLEAEKAELEERLKDLAPPTDTEETSTTETRSETDKETTSPSKSKSNSSVALENKELRYKVEILVVENRKLKEMVRRQHQDESELESDLGTPRSSVSEFSEDGNNNNNRKFILVSDESDF